MSPRFYSFLWIVYFVTAGVMWLAGALSMLAIVVFGFIAFGFVFMGMMCVLPGTVSHPEHNEEKIPRTERAAKSEVARPTKEVRGFSAYKPV